MADFIVLYSKIGFSVCLWVSGGGGHVVWTFFASGMVNTCKLLAKILPTPLPTVLKNESLLSATSLVLERNSLP